MRLKIHHAHRWDLTPAEARDVQIELEQHVVEEPLTQPVARIAGVDVSIKDNRVRAVVSVLSFPAFDVLDESVWEGPATFPYVPGYLSFREIPVLLKAMKGLDVEPDVWMTDGQGRAHPRRFGLACHLGVLIDRPTIGVAKSRLTGIHEEPCEVKGCRVPLLDPKADECIGAVVRTRTNVRPVFVSVGHKISLDQSIDITLQCATRFRIPEPTRRADRRSKEWKG